MRLQYIDSPGREVEKTTLKLRITIIKERTFFLWIHLDLQDLEDKLLPRHLVIFFMTDAVLFIRLRRLGKAYSVHLLSQLLLSLHRHLHVPNGDRHASLLPETTPGQLLGQL
jgi:hypothetical protein